MSALERLTLALEELLALIRNISGGDVVSEDKPFVPARRPDASEQVIVGRNGFDFSTRSLRNLGEVDAGLQRVAHLALSKTVVDFGVIEGTRTLAEQRKLVAKGASQTLNSKHRTGDAIDVLAYIGADHSWEVKHFLKIATAFVYAAVEAGVAVRWGGAWHIPDIRACADKGNPGAAMMELYRQHKKAQGRRTFVDAGHFELAT